MNGKWKTRIKMLTSLILTAFLTFVPKITGCRLGTALNRDKGRCFPAAFFPNFLKLFSFSSLPTAYCLLSTAYCVFRDCPENHPPLLLSSEVLVLSNEVLVLLKQLLVLPKYFLLLPEQVLPLVRQGFVPV